MHVLLTTRILAVQADSQTNRSHAKYESCLIQDVKSLVLTMVLFTGFSLHGILQARILVWVAMPFSRRSSQPRDRTHVSCVSCIGRQVLYHWCHLGEFPPLYKSPGVNIVPQRREAVCVNRVYPGRASRVEESHGEGRSTQTGWVRLQFKTHWAISSAWDVGGRRLKNPVSL